MPQHNFDGQIVFCVTCLNRGKHALVSLLVNIVLAWRYRKHVRFCIVTWGEDNALWERMQSALWPAWKLGLLVGASGGQFGRKQVYDANECDGPYWMNKWPGRCDRGQSGCKWELKYWHASIAKNSVHKLAEFHWGIDDVWFVNLDADNLMPEEYVASLIDMCSTRKNVVGACVQCRGDVGLGMTGRLCYRAKDFVELRGYDEDSTPSGGQDVDLRARLELMAEEALGYKDRPLTSPKVRDWSRCGMTIVNDWEGDPDDTKTDRSAAKLRHCSEHDMAPYMQYSENKRWQKMNEVGWAHLQKKLSEGQLRRNLYPGGEAGPPLGAWWSRLEWAYEGHTLEHQERWNPSFLSRPQSRALAQLLLGPPLTNFEAGAAPGSPAAGTVVPVTVHVSYTGLRRFWFMNRTNSTCPIL